MKVFRIFDPVAQELYFLCLATVNTPPAGLHFPLLVEGWVIFGDHFWRGRKCLASYLVGTQAIYIYIW